MALSAGKASVSGGGSTADSAPSAGDWPEAYGGSPLTLSSTADAASAAEAGPTSTTSTRGALGCCCGCCGGGWRRAASTGPSLRPTVDSERLPPGV